jgi:hypothetical protein
MKPQLVLASADEVFVSMHSDDQLHIMTCLVPAEEGMPSPPDYGGNGGFQPPSVPSVGGPDAPPAGNPGSADSSSSQGTQLGLAIGLSLGLAAMVCALLGSWWYMTKRKTQAYLHGMPDKLKHGGLTGHSPPQGSDSGLGSSSGDGTWPGTGTPDRGRQHSPGAATPSSSSSASKQLVTTVLRPASAPHQHVVHIPPASVPESAPGVLHHAAWIPGGGTGREHSSTTASSIPSRASHFTVSLEMGPGHLQDPAPGSTASPSPAAPGSWEVGKQSQGSIQDQAGVSTAAAQAGATGAGVSSMAAASMPGPWAGHTGGSPAQPVLSANSAEPGVGASQPHTSSEEGSKATALIPRPSLGRSSVPAVIQQQDESSAQEPTTSVSKAATEQRPHSSGASVITRRQAPISCLQLLTTSVGLGPPAQPTHQEGQQQQLLQPTNVSQVTISPEGMPSVQVATSSQTAGIEARDGRTTPVQAPVQLDSLHPSGEHHSIVEGVNTLSNPPSMPLASTSLPLAGGQGQEGHVSSTARASSGGAYTGKSTAATMPPAPQAGTLTAAASLATTSAGGAAPGVGLSGASNSQQAADGSGPAGSSNQALGRSSAGAAQVPEPVREIEQLINELRGGEGSELTILHPIGQGGFGTVYKGEECSVQLKWTNSQVVPMAHLLIHSRIVPQGFGVTLKSR